MTRKNRKKKQKSKPRAAKSGAELDPSREVELQPTPAPPLAQAKPNPTTQSVGADPEASPAEAEPSTKRSRSVLRRFGEPFGWALLGALLGPIVSNGFAVAHIASGDPVLKVESELTPWRTYSRGLPPGSVNVPLPELPNGSLYHYRVNVSNTGDGPLHNVKFSLNLPGVPVVTNASDGEIDVDVVTVTFVDFSLGQEIKTQRDPRVIEFPEYFFSRFTFTDENGTDLGGTGYEPMWSGDRHVIHASGPETASFALDRLSPGVTWQLDVVYFGNGTADGAGARVSATPESYDGVPRPFSATIAAFDPNAEAARIETGSWDKGFWLSGLLRPD